MKKLVTLMFITMICAMGAWAGAPGEEVSPQVIKFGEAPITQPTPAVAEEIVVPQDITAFETPVVKEVKVTPTIEVVSEPKFEVKSNPKTVVITPDVRINEVPETVKVQETPKKELLPVTVATPPTNPEVSYCCCLPYCCAPSLGVSEVAVAEEPGYFSKVASQVKEGVVQSAFCWTPIFTSQSDAVEVSSANSGFWHSTDGFVSKSIDGISGTVSKAGHGVWKVASAPLQ